MERAQFPQGVWFWLVLVKIPVRSLRELQDRNRVPVRDRVPLAVQTRVFSIGRFEGREATISFGGVTRAAVKRDADAIGIAWGKPVIRGHPIARSSTATLDGYVLWEAGPHLMLAQVFWKEVDARAWAKERATVPVP